MKNLKLKPLIEVKDNKVIKRSIKNNVNKLNINNMREKFTYCLKETQKNHQYIDGEKEDFVKDLASQCNRMGISANKAKIYIKEAHNFNDDTVTGLIEDIYQNKKEFDIVNKKSIESYLSEKYDFRHNEVLGRTEYKLKQAKEYSELKEYDLNSLFRELKNSEYKITKGNLNNLLISDFIPVYNPFKEYFDNLPEWDGIDYIKEFSKLVKTDDDEFWQDALKRFLVSMVACSISNSINHSVIVLKGGQGIGKSTFINSILPLALSHYKYSGLINPENKDTLILMSENILIDLDELASLNRKEEKSMKELITKSSIKLRRPYGRINEDMPRRASFIASVNEQEFLTDLTGNRRYLCFEAFEIDNKTERNYTGIYSQAMHLYQNRFKYWFDEEDIQKINERNEKFRIKDPVEELILLNYEPCNKEETTNFLTATEILLELKNSNILLSTTNSMMVGRVLNKHGFEKVKKGGIQKYAVKRKLNK